MSAQDEKKVPSKYQIIIHYVICGIIGRKTYRTNMTIIIQLR